MKRLGGIQRNMCEASVTRGSSLASDDCDVVKNKSCI